MRDRAEPIRRPEEDVARRASADEAAQDEQSPAGQCAAEARESGEGSEPIRVPEEAG